MKTRYLKVLVVLGCTAVFMASCGKSEIEPYESKAKLWFTQDYYAGTPVTKHDANDVKRSFALFPGEKTLDIPFEINLIGDVAGNDRSYSVVVVDSLTTAVESEYKILSTTFRAEHSVDTLWVQLVWKTIILRLVMINGCRPVLRSMILRLRPTGGMRTLS